MAVRYDTEFKKEINKVINAYNRKIQRLSKSGENYMLPEKFGEEAYKSLKATSLTRADVRRKLKDLQSFTARGGEKNITVNGATMPKYLHTNIKRYQRLLKTQTTRKLKAYETRKPVQNGEIQPFTFSQYGSQEYLTLKAKRMTLLDKDLSAMSPRELKTYLEKLEANTKKVDLKIWQNNYLGILEDTALSYGYDPDKLDVIIERFSKLSASDFDDLTFINRNIKDIIYKYKALTNIETSKELADIGEDVIANLDSIYENLDEILKDYE